MSKNVIIGQSGDDFKHLHVFLNAHKVKLIAILVTVLVF